jgi:hypothetical protein
MPVLPDASAAADDALPAIDQRAAPLADLLAGT